MDAETLSNGPRLSLGGVSVSTTWLIAVMMGLLGWIVSGYVGYTNNDKIVAARITALETHREDDSARLQRLEAKLDTLLTILTNQQQK
jgi:hypothetical protein